ncbi:MULTISPECIES: DMT family transporter [Acinetobacter]|uniref:EamA family transporter n=1 Tax=Acinetobacter pseudolwoffii TaxID=2053287 RepID=A0A2H9YVU4_9GAMM|nr:MULTISPECIES: EamA family transporter [Acinetobacter]MCP0911546.1 EamA family transporter [Acinetobacter pseudolwoffii]MDM1322767.1 EamA family transporter [Acinetobacter pseudolwoffii]MDM1343765.1 EamA family transporter [Acinetobacter pseudolwoffii]PJO76744.1 EamA family transporter [Acinetobacter pseudolwoffii]UBX52132.1 EamA family transporter [Acinetobacter pseudolwoffii]
MNSNSSPMLVTASIYALLVLIWAATPLAIVWSVAEIHPMWVLIIRYFGASIIALFLLKIMRDPLPFDSTSMKSYLAGSLNLIGAQLFIYLAANYLTSGLMALIFGFSPLIAGLIGHVILKTHQLVWLQWSGMAVAIAGLSFVFLDSADSKVNPWGVVLMLISMVSYISSIFWVKQINAPLSPMSQATGSLLLSAAGSLLLIPFIWQHMPTQLPGTQALIGFVFTMIMSSIVAMLCYFWLIRRLNASTVSLSNVMTPVIALVLGATLNHEIISSHAFAGIAVVMFGIIMYFWKEWREQYFSKR